MKRTKINRCVTMVCTLFAIACSDNDERGDYKPIKVQSYIMTYLDGELQVRFKENKLFIGFSNQNIRFYYCPEMDVQPQTHARFLQIATANGDMSYNDFVPYLHQFDCCFADNFNEMHIVSDTDWDADFPAGALLDDLVIVEALSYAPFIRNGYRLIPTEDLLTDKVKICKRVSELTDKDLNMIFYQSDFGIGFWFDTPPKYPEKEHTLIITLITTTGRTHTVRTTCIPPVVKPLEPK